MDLVTEGMGKLPSKLLELLNKEYKLQKGVKAQVESLTEELESIHAALRKVSEVPWDQLDEQVKVWARQAREASYDMEDALDTFLVRVEGGPNEPADAGKVKRLLKKMGNLLSLNKLKARHEIAGAIEDIKKRVEEIEKRRARYRVDSLVPKPPTTTSIDPRRLSGFYEKASQLVGIDVPRDMLLKMLSVGDSEVSDKVMKIVSIVGFGGLGKTTLAKAVHNKLKPQYDCGAFVSVGQIPNWVKVFKDTLSDLDKERYKDIHKTEKDVHQLINELREFLENKRYFIVIDDLWNKQSWDRITYAFDENNLGSRIITTTRNIDVAEYVGGSNYILKPLTHESSKTLFYGRIFGSENKCPPHFFEVSEKILKKCGGVPLAITTISGLLANKLENITDWDKLCDSIGSGLGDDPKKDDMINILLLSYYDLPSYLKACLLYLSIFPEDYEIRMDRLVLRWIAEDFIGERAGNDLFEVGERYFNELINRSMIQLVKKGTDFIYCRVHDVVLDLIRSLAREENFVTVQDGIQRKACPQCKVRRLSLQNSSIGATVSMSQVRSLTIFSPAIDSMPPLKRFHILRVLDLEGCASYLNLSYVGNLIHLRYLGLRYTNVGELPVEIRKLKFLQTLDFSNTPVQELPASIVQLGRLIYLRLGYMTWWLPSGIRNLTTLQELSYVSTVVSAAFVKELGGLTELRVLRILLWEPDQRLMEALVESLRNLGKIQTLDITIKGRTIRNWSRMMDVVREAAWTPPRSLRKFQTCNAHLQLLPAWVDALTTPNLTVLVVQVLELRQQDIDALGRLPVLEVLHLEMYYTTEPLTVGPSVFPRLINCGFMGWSPAQPVFCQGAMPWLRWLKFRFRVRETIDLGNGGFEFGLKNLGSLEEATVVMCHWDASEAEVVAAKEALRRAEDNHPNRATFHVTTER